MEFKRASVSMGLRLWLRKTDGELLRVLLMKYKVQCQTCPTSIWVRGVYEPDTNATVLNDDDSGWEEGCAHIAAGDYDITGEEVDPWDQEVAL
jgi:hypothetical protein